MKMLITGIAGFIGSCFAEWVGEHHPEVYVYGVDDLSSGYDDRIPDNCEEWLMTSLGHDEEYLEGYFRDQEFDIVVHCAAFAAECLSPFCRERSYRNNIMATMEVINCCLRHPVKRLVYLSSIAAFGDSGFCLNPDSVEHSFRETDRKTPKDPYGVAKLCCEMDLMIAHKQHGLPVTILRPFNVYGPGQSIHQKYRNVFGIWSKAVLEDRPITIYGDGYQIRSFTYIDDILRPMWIAATGEHTIGEDYNIGSMNVWTLNNAADLFQDIVQDIVPKPDIAHLESRNEVRIAHCNCLKAQHALGLRDTTSLKTGLTEMWEWVKEDFKKPDRDPEPVPIEVQDGLYSYWKT